MADYTSQTEDYLTSMNMNPGGDDDDDDLWSSSGGYNHTQPGSRLLQVCVCAIYTYITKHTKQYANKSFNFHFFFF